MSYFKNSFKIKSENVQNYTFTIIAMSLHATWHPPQRYDMPREVMVPWWRVRTPEGYICTNSITSGAIMDQ